MNIHGCQLHPKVAIYVVKQLKNDSFCQGLYHETYKVPLFDKLKMVHNNTVLKINGALVKSHNFHSSGFQADWNESTLVLKDDVSNKVFPTETYITVCAPL